MMCNINGLIDPVFTCGPRCLLMGEVAIYSAYTLTRQVTIPTVLNTHPHAGDETSTTRLYRRPRHQEALKKECSPVPLAHLTTRNYTKGKKMVRPFPCVRTDSEMYPHVCIPKYPVHTRTTLKIRLFVN